MSTVNVVLLQDHSYVCNIHLSKLHFYHKFMITKFTPAVYNYAYVMLGEMGCFRSSGVRSISWGCRPRKCFHPFLHNLWNSPEMQNTADKTIYQKL